MKKNKTQLIIITLLILVALALGLFKWLKKPAAVQYETTVVMRGDIMAKVTATGVLSSLVTVQVGSQVSGRIQSIDADFNTVVKKGQRIAKIDPMLFKANVEQAQANALVAQGNLNKAKLQQADADRQLKRSLALFEQKLIAQAELDTAQSNADSARAQVDIAHAQCAQTRAALHQTQLNLEYTTIISPINGIVISRNIDVGQTVAASFQSPTLFTIAEDLKKMQVDISISESDIGKIKVGIKASFTVDAYPGERFSGTIKQIRNLAQTLQNVVTYNAIIEVDNKDLKLKPGMTANVSMIYAEQKQILKVAQAALRFKPSISWLKELGLLNQEESALKTPKTKKDNQEYNPQKWIYRLNNNQRVERLKITTGLSDGTMTEILSDDLKEGDILITDIKNDNDDKDKNKTPPRNMGRL